jgi:hypothetical protein
MIIINTDRIKKGSFAVWDHGEFMGHMDKCIFENIEDFLQHHTCSDETIKRLEDQHAEVNVNLFDRVKKRLYEMGWKIRICPDGSGAFLMDDGSTIIKRFTSTNDMAEILFIRKIIIDGKEQEVTNAQHAKIMDILK